MNVKSFPNNLKPTAFKPLTVTKYGAMIGGFYFLTAAQYTTNRAQQADMGLFRSLSA
jgi:hypothetical protein